MGCGQSSSSNADVLPDKVTKPSNNSSSNPKGTELDLAFCCDCTGSMGAYIESAQDNIIKIATDIKQKTSSGVSTQFGLVKYRDHSDDFVTEVFDFHPDMARMKKAVDTMSASGGGDGPEAVAPALHEVNQLKWRPNATKVVVLISDAPPHGLGESGDYHPDGCPLGHDPIVIAKEMAAKGIIIYAVGVEPVLSTQYNFARDFMMSLAEMTQGRFVPLGKAEILADVVVSGALEGVSMERTWAKIEAEIAAEADAKGEKLSLTEKQARAESRVRDHMKNHKMRQVDVSNPYMDGYDHRNSHAIAHSSSSLADARSRLDSGRNAGVSGKAASEEWMYQVSRVADTEWTYEQQSRCINHGAVSSAGAAAAAPQCGDDSDGE